MKSYGRVEGVGGLHKLHPAFLAETSCFPSQSGYCALYVMSRTRTKAYGEFYTDQPSVFAMHPLVFSVLSPCLGAIFSFLCQSPITRPFSNLKHKNKQASPYYHWVSETQRHTPLYRHNDYYVLPTAKYAPQKRPKSFCSA